MFFSNSLELFAGTVKQMSDQFLASYPTSLQRSNFETLGFSSPSCRHGSVPSAILQQRGFLMGLSDGNLFRFRPSGLAEHVSVASPSYRCVICIYYIQYIIVLWFGI